MSGPAARRAVRAGWAVQAWLGAVRGVGVGRGQQPGAVHEPGGVVPVHPGGGNLLDVAAAALRAVAEWRPVPVHSDLQRPMVVSARALS